MSEEVKADPKPEITRRRGRKTVESEKIGKRVWATINDAHGEKLRVLAFLAGCTISDVVLKAVAAYTAANDGAIKAVSDAAASVGKVGE